MVVGSAEVGTGCEVKERRQKKSRWFSLLHFYAIPSFLLIHTHSCAKCKSPHLWVVETCKEGYSRQNKIHKLSLSGTVCAELLMELERGGRCWGGSINCVCVPVDFLSVHDYSNGGNLQWKAQKRAVLCAY
jgi:hypothetical protein